MVMVLAREVVVWSMEGVRLPAEVEMVLKVPDALI
jgi:hypothetical protein